MNEPGHLLSRRTVLGAGTAGAVVAASGGALLSPAGAATALSADQIRRAQTRLNEQGYWCGSETGVADDLTTCAVLAYQKSHGWKADGVLDYDVAVALTKVQPAAPRFTTVGTVVEVDLKRQLVRVVVNGTIRFTLHATTGDGEVSSFGERSVLNRTPTGKYHVRRTEDGVVTNSLGTQYRPFYLRGRYGIYGMSAIAQVRAPSTTGGIAIHPAALDMLAQVGYLALRRLVKIV